MNRIKNVDNFLIQKRKVHYEMQLWKIISSGFDRERVFAIQLKYKKGYLWNAYVNVWYGIWINQACGHL